MNNLSSSFHSRPPHCLNKQPFCQTKWQANPFSLTHDSLCQSDLALTRNLASASTTFGRERHQRWTINDFLNLEPLNNFHIHHWHYFRMISSFLLSLFVCFRPNPPTLPAEMTLAFYRQVGKLFIQIRQKSRRIGCVIPRCKLKRRITQPILRLFWHICTYVSRVPFAFGASYVVSSRWHCMHRR